MATFPDGLLWWAATAAHQAEGGNTSSDLWRVENFPGTLFAEPSGDACDSCHRYPEDLDLLAGAGLRSYRFGVKWARVEPEDGMVSRASLDHYRRMLAACHQRGITPVANLQPLLDTALLRRRWRVGFGHGGRTVRHLRGDRHPTHRRPDPVGVHDQRTEHRVDARPRPHGSRR